MDKSVVDSVFINVARDVIGGFLDRIRRVTHRNRDARAMHHFKVVSAIAKRDRIGYRRANMLHKPFNGSALVDTDHIHFTK